MYLNEKAWEIQQDNEHTISEALKIFLDMYSVLARDFQITQIFVPEDEQIYFRSAYSIEKWLSEVDIEYKRLFLSFWNKRIFYTPDSECEVSLNGESLKGGTEAALNDSFMLSLCLDQTWKKEHFEAEMFSLDTLMSETVSLYNAYLQDQLFKKPIADILSENKKVKLYSYIELWERRQMLFPHLKFCPSVEKDLEKLEKSYLQQVVKKLQELETAAAKGKFAPALLTKTTSESEATLSKYKKQHIFIDEGNQEYLAKWHMRFTGIPGRIFFIPEYTKESILICYIGKKLPNVSYPT